MIMAVYDSREEAIAAGIPDHLVQRTVDYCEPNEDGTPRVTYWGLEQEAEDMIQAIGRAAGLI